MSIIKHSLWVKSILVLVCSSQAYGMATNLVADLAISAVQVLGAAATAAFADKCSQLTTPKVDTPKEVDVPVKKTGELKPVAQPKRDVKVSLPEAKEAKKTPSPSASLKTPMYILHQQMNQPHTVWIANKQTQDFINRTMTPIAGAPIMRSHVQAEQLSKSWHTLARIVLPHGSGRKKSFKECHAIMDKLSHQLDMPGRMGYIAQLEKGVDKLEKILLNDGSKEPFKGPMVEGDIPVPGGGMQWNDKDPDGRKKPRNFNETTHGAKNRLKRKIDMELAMETLKKPDLCRYGDRVDTVEFFKKILEGPNAGDWVKLVWGIAGEPQVVTIMIQEAAQVARALPALPKP